MRGEERGEIEKSSLLPCVVRPAHAAIPSMALTIAKRAAAAITDYDAVCGDPAAHYGYVASLAPEADYPLGRLAWRQRPDKAGRAVAERHLLTVWKVHPVPAAPWHCRSAAPRSRSPGSAHSSPDCRVES